MLFFHPYIEIFLREIKTFREKHKIIDVPFLLLKGNMKKAAHYADQLEKMLRDQAIFHYPPNADVWFFYHSRPFFIVKRLAFKTFVFVFYHFSDRDVNQS
jgi:hypothetical protein